MLLKRIKSIVYDLHLIVEFMIGFGTIKKNALHHLITTFVLVTSVLLFLIGVLLPLFTFYNILNLYLRCKLGKKYAGLLSGQDAAFESHKEPCLIVITMVIRRERSFKDFLKCIQSYEKKLRRFCSKLDYSVKEILGYKYFVTNSPKTNDNISDICINDDEYITKDMIHEYIVENCMSDKLVKDKMYHITVFRQPIKWNGRRDTPKYAVIFTIRHCLGDGVSIVGLLKNKVFDNVEFVSIKNAKGVEKTTIKNAKGVERTINDTNVYSNHWRTTQTCSKFNFDSRNFVSFYVEDEVSYLPKIKYIKNKLKVQFNDVLVAVVAHAVVFYTKKKNITLQNLLGTSIVRPLTKSTEQLYMGSFDYHSISNEVGLLLLDIPWKGISSLMELVLRTHEVTQKVHATSQMMLLYYMMRFSRLLPNPFLRIAYDFLSFPLWFDISNVSGVDTPQSADAKLIDNFIFFTPNSLKSGLSLRILALSQKFNITLHSNNGVVETQEELNDILQDILKNIDNLYEEVMARIGINELVNTAVQ